MFIWFSCEIIGDITFYGYFAGLLTVIVKFVTQMGMFIGKTLDLTSIVNIERKAQVF